MTPKRGFTRVSKAEIYASYGIEYRNGKILSPLYGWINPLLINGNKKLGHGVYTWSMLPTNEMISYFENGIKKQEMGTCPCTCRDEETGEKTCYACGGCYLFNSTKLSLARKTILARVYMDFVKRAIIAQIKASHIHICRIHAAGDFFNAAYIEMWRDICRACPECLFWSYTKNPAAESAFDNIENCNIVKSLIPGRGKNYGKAGYVMSLYYALKAAGKTVYICRCGIDKNQHCTNCRHCAESEFVLFLEHGTSYKPEDDPLFPAFVALVESQEEEESSAAA